MNIQESLKNLSIKMQQKNFLFVTNNIHEIFINKETREISTIIDKIYEIATKELKHKQVIYFGFGRGIKVLGDSNPEFTDETLTNFRDHIKRDIEDINENKQHSTYVIDFGDFILDQDSKGGDPFNIILEIMALILTSQNKNSSQLSNNKLQSKMIFIMRDAGHIINYITNKNVEYAEVLISKPDPSERQKLFNQVASRFFVNNSQELRQKDSPVQIEAVALFDIFAKNSSI